MKNIHILPTENPSRLRYDTYNEIWYFSTIPKNSTDIKRTHHMYITSYEEIKERDWIISKSTGKLIKSSKSYYTNNEYGKKIILTTDPELIKDGVQAIDDEFLQWFVKNSSCMRIEVHHFGTCCGNQLINHCIHCKKYNPVYKIIIPQEEPKEKIEEEAKKRAKNTMALKGALDIKEETLEEAAKNFAITIQTKEGTVSRLNAIEWFKAGAKWQQERMYNEADKIMKFLDIESKLKLSEVKTIERIKWYFETYFEQFKKK